MSSTFESVKSVVVEQLSVDANEVKLESRFIEDLNADSLDVVELVMALEKNSQSKFLMKMRRKSKPLKMLLIILIKQNNN